MNYFKDCKTQEEAKKRFRKLAMKLHPDHGGKKEDMIELQRQYESFGTHSFNRFERSSTMNEDQFNQMKDSFNKGYTAYGGGGYQYANNSNMRNEYFKQQNDPRLADYERMKRSYDDVEKRMFRYMREKNELEAEIDSLKKKMERLKKKLNPVSKQPSKRKKKDLENVISL